jgi:hypothetical protein
MAHSLLTVTDPGSAKWLRSFRSRSTIMMFSARSLSEVSSSRRSRASVSGSDARRLVPLIGSARMPPSAAIFRNRSGDVLATVSPPNRR